MANTVKPSEPTIVRFCRSLDRSGTALDRRLAQRLGLPPFDSGQKRMCATVEYGNDLYSLLVDAVGEVLTLPSRRVETNPNNLSANWREVSAGVIRLDKELVVVLDIDRLLQTLVH